MKKLHSDLFETGGKDKIDIDEIAMLLDGNLKLLSQLVMGDFGSNSNGNYFKHPSGLLICYKQVPEVAVTNNNLLTTHSFPASFVGLPALFYGGFPTDGAGNWKNASVDGLSNAGYWYPRIKNPNNETVTRVINMGLLAIGVGSNL